MIKYLKKNPLLLFFILLPLDQLSKYIIRTQGGFYICNKGIAWGIRIPELLIFSVTLLMILFFISYRNHLKNSVLPMILISAGAISNIIDRLSLDCVIDFIDLRFWPIFNLADIYISLGAIILITKYLKR